MNKEESSYQLLDSGDGKKIERFGPVSLVRPAAGAVWEPEHRRLWKNADAEFSREREGWRWERNGRLPEQWEATHHQLRFILKRTDFGHVGLFPEHAAIWDWVRSRIAERPAIQVLNLFAYSGGATLAAAAAGAQVCHVDASKGMVEWARENAALNGLEQHPIRWIVDDVFKFLAREARRGRRYDGIILDPPSFGRGKRGEVFKVEEDLIPLLDLCVSVLSEQADFMVLSCHTPGYTPTTLQQLLKQRLAKNGEYESGEMLLPGKNEQFSIPSGSFARWSC